MEKTIIERLEAFKDIYSQLYASLKWKTDKRSLMLIAAMYVTNSKEFHLKRFLDIADYIKSEVSLFSQLRSVHRFTTAATLDTSTESPKEMFHHFITIYEKLIQIGFSRTIYTYIAAGTLIKVEPNRIDELVQKTNDIYKGMREHHFFLTNSSDYPLAAILATLEKDTDETIEHVEEYYNHLKQNGLTIGNDLQFLSHILALDSDYRFEERAQLCIQIKEQLKKANFSSKKAYYPYIGMLSYAEKIEEEIHPLHQIYQNLNNDKHFKWNKDINFMLSVLLIMSDKTLLGDAARAGLNTTIEVLIQAQQAALTASMAASAAASSSSGGDS